MRPRRQGPDALPVQAVAQLAVLAFQAVLAGTLSLTAVRRSTHVAIEIEDRGRGFLRGDAPERRGWRLTIIARAADRFELVTGAGGGTRLRLEFGLAEG